MSTYKTFLSLHQQDQPLLIGNAWDITSAKIFERMGYKAVATSSAALARSMGYEDKEQIPFDLLLSIVKGMSRQVSIPFSVDLEAGYSRNIPEIIDHIEKLHDLGVVGFNLEDSVITEKGKLQPVEDFQRIISSVMGHLSRKNMNMFFNARTDAFVHKLPNALEETIKRAEAYEEAGASGIFVPFLDDEKNTRQIVQATRLPVNIFVTPTLPAFDRVAPWGVRRISMGGSIYRSMITSLEKTVKAIQDDQSFAALFE